MYNSVPSLLFSMLDPQSPSSNHISGRIFKKTMLLNEELEDNNANYMRLETRQHAWLGDRGSFDMFQLLERTLNSWEQNRCVRGTLKRLNEKEIGIQTVHHNAYHEDHYARQLELNSVKSLLGLKLILCAPWFPLHIMLMSLLFRAYFYCSPDFLTPDQRPVVLLQVWRHGRRSGYTRHAGIRSECCC